VYPEYLVSNSPSPPIVAVDVAVAAETVAGRDDDIDSAAVDESDDIVDVVAAETDSSVDATDD
jgi:hypothetical protein